MYEIIPGKTAKSLLQIFYAVEALSFPKKRKKEISHLTR